MNKQFLCSLVIFNCISMCAVTKLLIMTTHGPVLGKLNKYNNFSYISFRGIPYAENPSGEQRFKPPISKKPWTNVFDATQEGVVCPQWNMRYKYEEMSEDCLNINIYAPENKGRRLLPVFVIIHGGAFALLSGRSDYIYGPQFFLQHEIIVVTFNFRIGPLGFLSLDINEASGNAGIKDIILALKWVKANIGKFGGNCNKVTIGGHSSGAALAHLLMLTKHTHRLFHHAILISGSSLNHRLFSRHAKYDALALAQKLGLETNNVQKVLRNLKTIDVFEILEAFKKLSVMDRNILKPCTLFAPSIEIASSHAVLTTDPIKIMRKTGLTQNIPILVGVNAQEALYMLPMLTTKQEIGNKLKKYPEHLIPSDIEYPIGSEVENNLGNLISEMYFYGMNANKNITENLLQLASDIRYNYGVYSLMKLHKSKSNSSKIYSYIMDFDGDLNWSKLNYGIEYPGTAHADELGYIFVTNRTVNRLPNASERSKRMLSGMVDLLSNFIKFGDPTHDEVIEWPEFDLKHQQYLLLSDISTTQSLLSSSMSTRLRFWEDIYNEYYSYVQNGGKLENRCIIH